MAMHRLQVLFKDFALEDPPAKVVRTNSQPQEAKTDSVSPNTSGIRKNNTLTSTQLSTIIEEVKPPKSSKNTVSHHSTLTNQSEVMLNILEVDETSEKNSVDLNHKHPQQPKTVSSPVKPLPLKNHTFQTKSSVKEEAPSPRFGMPSRSQTKTQPSIPPLQIGTKPTEMLDTFQGQVTPPLDILGMLTGSQKESQMFGAGTNPEDGITQDQSRIFDEKPVVEVSMRKTLQKTLGLDLDSNKKSGRLKLKDYLFMVKAARKSPPKKRLATEGDLPSSLNETTSRSYQQSQPTLRNVSSSIESRRQKYKMSNADMRSMLIQELQEEAEGTIGKMNQLKEMIGRQKKVEAEGDSDEMVMLYDIRHKFKEGINKQLTIATRKIQELEYQQKINKRNQGHK